MQGRLLFHIQQGLLICLLSGLLTSCASKKYTKSNLSFSFNQILTVVKKHLPTGVSWESPNNRSLRSHYFRPVDYKKDYRDTRKDIYRAKARVWILGARRPYRLVLRVYIEKRKSGGPRKVRSQADLEAGQWVYIKQDGDIG